MDELRTTLNTVLDTVEKELAAARGAESLLLKAEKERDEFRQSNESLRSELYRLHTDWMPMWACGVVGCVCFVIGWVLGYFGPHK